MRKKLAFIFLTILTTLCLFVGVIWVFNSYLVDLLPETDRFKFEAPLPLDRSSIHFSRIELEPQIPIDIHDPAEMEKRKLALSSQVYRRFLRPEVEDRVEGPRLHFRDPDFGLANLPNATARQQVFDQSHFVYDVKYHTDQYARRITPVTHKESRNQFMLFLGCSFTFGVGSNDDQTLPYYFGKEVPDFLPLNYGIGGTGTATALALLESNRLRAQVEPKTGIGFYLFIDDHLWRTVSNTFWSRTLPDTPNYELDGKGNVIRRGNFKTGRPLRTYLHTAFDKSAIAKKFKLVWPVNPDEEDYLLICGMMEKMKSKFLEQFPGSEFFIGFPPGTNQHFEPLTACLKNRKVQYLDLRNAIEAYDPKIKMRFEYDAHPTPAGHQATAHALAESLKKIGSVRSWH